MGLGRCFKVTLQTRAPENFRSRWWGAERRVSRAQTQERGPPSAWAEIHYYLSVGSYIRCLEVVLSPNCSLGFGFPVIQIDWWWVGCPINTCIALNFCAEQELLCIYISEQIKKNWNHSTIFRAQAVNLSARLYYKGIRLKIQRKICLQTIFALIWGRMGKLTYRLHQIATFLLVFPKTPIMAIFDAIKAICLYGY